jgi:hypothetical protein
MTPITAVWPGRPDPHGATWDGEGVSFALFSEKRGAHRVVHPVSADGIALARVFAAIPVALLRYETPT